MAKVTETSGSEDKLDVKRILPIFIIVLVDLLGLTIIIPLLPLYATTFGASPLVVGLLGAAYPIMQFLGAPMLGRLSDRYGRKPILVISQIGTLIGFLVLGFAGALWMLFLSRIVDGISGANIATAQAAISDSTSEKTRTQGLGLIGAAFGLGFTVGPVIAFVSLQFSDQNYHVPAFVAAAFSLASILLTVFWFQETLPAGRRDEHSERASFSFKSLISAISHPAVGLLLVLMFSQQLAFGGFEQLLALFTLNRLGLNASGNAIVFVYVGIIVVAVQGGLIGRWSRRFGDRRLIYAGLALLAVGLLAIGLTAGQPPPWYSQADVREELLADQSLPGETPPTEEIPVSLPDDNSNGWLGMAWLLVAMIPVAIGGGILQPAINSLITKRIDVGDVGGMLGISAAFLSAANAVAPIIGGALFEAIGSGAPFVFWSLLMAALLVVAVRAIRPGREESSPAGLARGGGH